MVVGNALFCGISDADLYDKSQECSYISRWFFILEGAVIAML